MPRIRTIKPEFFRSPDTAKASFEARILFQALWCWANDWGIGETNINGLLGMAFPDEDGIGKERLLGLLAEVRDCYGVRFYTVRQRHFYFIPSWDDHQRTQRRAFLRLPLPDDQDATDDLRLPDKQGNSYPKQGSSAQAQGNVRAGKGKGKGKGTGEVGNLSLVGGGVGGEVIPQPDAPAKAVATTRGTRIAVNYIPPDQVIQTMRAEFPFITRDEWASEHRQFVDYWQAQAGSRGCKLDWDATWRSWMRREFRKDKYSQRVSTNGQRVSTVDQKILNLQAMKEQT